MSQGEDPIEELRPIAMTAGMMATRAAEAMSRGAQARKEQEHARTVEETRDLERRHQAQVEVDRLVDEQGRAGERPTVEGDAAVLDQTEADQLRETERDLDGQAQLEDDPDQAATIYAEARENGDLAAALEESADLHSQTAEVEEVDYDTDERRAVTGKAMATHHVPAEQIHAHQVADRLNGVDPKVGPELSRRKSRGRQGSAGPTVGKSRDRSRGR